MKHAAKALEAAGASVRERIEQAEMEAILCEQQLRHLSAWSSEHRAMRIRAATARNRARMLRHGERPA